MARKTHYEFWRLRPTSSDVSPHAQAELVNELGLHPLTAQILVQRGHTQLEEVQAFLSPQLESLTSPWKILDMERAVDRLVQAREQGESVQVFGDYDVDGTCGAALLGWVFSEMGLSHHLAQPDRFKDGYGLNRAAVEEFHARGIRCLVTVDCGVTSFEALERAKALGMDVLVVDHHQVDVSRGLPPAYAVIDPQRAEDPSGLKQLCGCGLAFYLAMALRARGRERGWFEGRPVPNLKAHLDLVVIATAADQVPLVGDNRILVKQGLEVLKQTRKPGLKALLEVSGIGASQNTSPGHLGFTLGPRINASGRIQHAGLALELLTTRDPVRGIEAAREIEKLNQERMEIQNRIWDEVKARVEAELAQGLHRHAVVVADASWHEGVVGIVASRVTETFKRPAIVIALMGDHGKGSARTWHGKDVLAAIRQAGGCLKGFGGHRHAAGVALHPSQVVPFREAFDHAVGSLTDEQQEDVLWVDGECDLEDLSFELLGELESLAPFGPGNPEPVFRVKARAQGMRVLKGRHLKLQLGELEAMWFHVAEDEGRTIDFYRDRLEGRSGEFAAVPELNRFRGRVTPTLRVRDFRDDSLS